MKNIQKFTRTPTFMKTAQDILRKYTTFDDKGKAEENIFILKQQQEELLLLRKRLLEDEQYLTERINKSKEILSKMEKQQRVESLKKLAKDAIKKKEEDKEKGK